jgi:spermidine/putrescine transport system substrate-binding protein
MRKYVGIIGIALLLIISLNGCGGAASGSGGEQKPAAATPTSAKEEAATEETANTGTEATKAAPAAESANSELAKELSVFNWPDYIDQTILDDYTKQYGVKIIYDTYASNEDLLAKLQAGATGYDVIFPSDYTVTQMVELGMLAKIDHKNIPNMKNLDAFFLNPPSDPGLKHCMPYQWGTTGIAYSKKYFGDTPPDSWGYIYDPEKAKKWAGDGINILDDQREVIGQALKYLGYSLNDTAEAHLQEAKKAALAIKPYLKSFNSTDYDESLLVPGEVVISMAWNGDVAQTITKTTDEATGESDWAYVIPKEGSFIYFESACIPATSQRKTTAEHFINYILDAKVGATITNYTYYASPNKAAEQYISQDILSDPGIYPPEEVKAKLEYGKVLGEAVFLYDQIWTEIKSQ